MKKAFFVLGLLLNLSAIQPSFAFIGTYQVKPADIYEGYIVEKIWLNAYAKPAVTLSDIAYIPGVSLPKDATLSDPGKIQVVLGMERKKPFAVVRIPAYSAAQGGGVKQVTGFTLTLNEQPAQPKANVAKRTTDAANSVLANGTWYKIAVTKTGFYKIDNNLLSAMGVDPSGIKPANIRVFGNGGNMLSENNAVPRPSDLTENAIWVNDGGDNVFNTGDYAVFYATGPMGWNKDSVNKRFTHVKNLYTDTAYYFITFDQGPGLRIGAQPVMTDPNVTVSSFNYYDVHDSDMVNPATLGKLWLGEKFHPQLENLTQTFNFDLGTTVSDVYCTLSAGSTSGTRGSQFAALLNNNGLGSFTFFSATSGDDVMALKTDSWSGACNSATASVTVTFSPADESSVGYLDYIELNCRRNLIMTSDQMSFRDWESVGAGHVANYQLQGANGNTQVWDITDRQSPVLMNGYLSGSTYSFTQDAQMLHEFAAMNSSNLYAPKYIAQVANQNLHGSGQVDLIIVTYPDFIAAANQLADHHRSRDNMRVIVATTTQVYNEFSSGGQDISAIRDFARMFYKRAGADASQMPRYLLLMGGASYDYKNRTANNSNFVPVFESAESSNDLSSFSSDDFYSFLDDSEYIENTAMINTMDIAVGRLPARSAEDASALVNKIIAYKQPATLGPWRISSTFVADNNDNAGNHMDDAEAMAAAVDGQSKGLYNEDKVYLDAIPTVATPAGDRCPSANSTIDNNIYKGTFMVNYNGHGNTQVWATERILTQDDYNNWNNPNMLPFIVTATCDFGQFDHPQYVSAAEQLALRSNGGVIAILTTTQATFAVFNHEINTQYLAAQFARNPDGTWNTFGEANRLGKNVTYSRAHDAGEIANFRKFALLGDPALEPDFPEHNVQLDEIIDGVTMEHADTLKALGAYTVTGSVKDNSGNLLSGFNGLLYVTFLDKARNITTITSPSEVFKVRDNIIYKGKVTVQNGHFSFSFITPKDINYYYGKGKVSTYAHNGVTDAAGADTSFAVGGFSDHPQLNSNPPIVRAYINDSLFLNGGITGSNTSLFVTFYDQTGINVSGNGVGHDLIAVLDGNVEVPYILNNYYETAPNTYQRGYLTFPLTGLSEGRHTLTVKAWDVNDNTGEGTVDFIVVNGKVMEIQNLVNIPNPFTSGTRFVFEHNHPEEQLDVQLMIYNTAGGLVRTLKQTFTPTGSRSNEVTWDGTDNSGISLPSGVYVYKLNITSEKGFKATAYQKLVIVR